MNGRKRRKYADKPRDEFVEMHLECPCGTSSDAFCIRSDGTGFCFSCYKDYRGDKLSGDQAEVAALTKKEKKYEEMKIPEGADVEKLFVNFRGISKKTAEFYGVQTRFVDSEEFERGFPYGDAIKIKNCKKKDLQKIIGQFRKEGLFGQDLFDPGSKPGIVITEGEEDAMAAYDMLLGKMACVSVKSGAQSARSCLEDHWHYVDSFDKIYICFDNDPQGKAATKSIQGLFDFKKVYLVNLTKYKDANDYLENDEVSEFQNIVKASKRYAPSSIISTLEEFRRALTESQGEVIAEWPFHKLQEMTYGIKEGEVIILKAMEGVGKTQLFRATESHILETSDNSIGLIHLEEPNQRTLKAIAGHALDVNAVLPTAGLSDEEILKEIEKYEGRLYVHKPYDVDDEDAFFGTIRYLVSAMGCKVIFWDHISWVATSTLEDEDERKKLDRMSRKAKTLAEELKFAFVIISHVNDNGQTRGSRSITKDADTVINLYRDIEANSNKLEFTIEKNRMGGDTGPAGEAYFDKKTGKLVAEKPEISINE